MSADDVFGFSGLGMYRALIVARHSGFWNIFYSSEDAVKKGTHNQGNPNRRRKPESLARLGESGKIWFGAPQRGRQPAPSPSFLVFLKETGKVLSGLVRTGNVSRPPIASGITR